MQYLKNIIRKMCFSGEEFQGFQEFQEIYDRMKGKRGKTYY